MPATRWLPLKGLKSLRTRVIEPELMDDEPVEEAVAAMRSVERINALLGGNRVTRLLIDESAPHGPFSLLDVGAGGGQAGKIISAIRPDARVTSLDYRVHQVAAAHPPRLAADAFRLPFAPRSFDFVFCSLFLHHFEDEQIVQLLSGFAQVARRAVLVNDLERHRLAYHFLPATRWIFGWHPLTIYDGPISVRAAFRVSELEALAKRAGLRRVSARNYRPAFRIGLIGRVDDATP
jgi:SAM-dependent methyltransferase